MQLRNAILIALAFDATADEVAQAHELIDRVSGGIDPAYLVSATVGADGNVQTSGSGESFKPDNNGGDVELDKNGVPWDDRIHSSSKDNRLNADGTWRAKRNVDKTYAKRIEAELLAARSAQAPKTTPPSPGAAKPSAPAPTGGATPPMPGGNKPPMPGANAAPAETPYSALVKLIAANTKSLTNPEGVFDEAYITSILEHFEVPDASLQNLAHAPQLVEPIRAWLQSVLDGTA